MQQQQQDQEKEHQEQHRLETARDCAKDLIRSYVIDGWTWQQISKGHMGSYTKQYAAQVGAMGGRTLDHQGQRRSVTRQQIAVSQVGNTPCWAVFDLLEIMAEIRDEQRGYEQQSLAAIFAQQEEEEEERERAAQESAPPTKKTTRPAIYRSYYGGDCQNCGAPLGFIEVDGGRDRLYCDNKGKCRQAHHRKLEKEKKREQILQYNAELREYWHLHGIRGEVLLRLQEILIQHGKKAAKAATDAVIVACAAQEQAGNNEQVRLINEIMFSGEAIGYEEIRLEDFRISAGVDGWSEFVSHASTNLLRQLRGYLYEHEYQEEYKAKARRRLEELSRQEPAPQRSTTPPQA